MAADAAMHSVVPGKELGGATPAAQDGAASVTLAAKQMLNISFAFCLFFFLFVFNFLKFIIYL